MKTISIQDLSLIESQPQPTCASCALRTCCLPADLLEDSEKLNQFSAIVETVPLTSGEVFKQQGQPFESVFVIKSGSAKIYHRDAKGDEAIIGFYYPSEMLGVDAIANGEYPATAATLEAGEICKINFKKLKGLTLTLPELASTFCNMMSDAMVSSIKCSLMMSHVPAVERIAGFLLHVAHENNPDLSRHNRDFTLSMTKKDIANYLGITNETLSRSFAQLHEDGILSSKGKTIHIADMHKLVKLAARNGHSLSFGCSPKKTTAHDG